jgi:hypothetical protein
MCMVIPKAALAPLINNWPLQSFKLIKFIAHQAFGIEMANYSRKVYRRRFYLPLFLLFDLVYSLSYSFVCFCLSVCFVTMLCIPFIFLTFVAR